MRTVYWRLGTIPVANLSTALSALGPDHQQASAQRFPSRICSSGCKCHWNEDRNAGDHKTSCREFLRTGCCGGNSSPRGALEVDRAAVGIGLTAGLGKSGRLTGAGTPPTGGVVYGGVDVREVHSETLVKRWLKSRCWRAIAVLQAACTTTLVREHMSLHRPLTSACTM